MEHFTYLLVDLGCLLVPFIWSFHPAIRFNREWRALLPALALLITVFVTWDVLFTKAGVWGFNQRYVTGLFLINLPIEEWLFFICIPFACVFTYHCVERFNFLSAKVEPLMRIMTWFSFLTCLIVSVRFYDHWYTVTAHGFTAVLLFFHLVVWKTPYLSRFVWMYLLVLPAFITSNGILTGIRFWRFPLFNEVPTTVTDYVVWYDNTQNLGVRLFSIPLDDVAYGFGMLLLAVTVYHRCREASNY